MMIFNLIFFLTSNALTLRKDKSLLFSRISITCFLISALLNFNNLFVPILDKALGIFGGLFYLTTFTLSFNTFLYIVAAVIMTLTSYYPRKQLQKYLFQNITKYTFKINYDASDFSPNQFKILEYSLICLFAITGGVFLMSSSDIVSVFLSIELQSYALYILSTLYRDSEKATEGGLVYFLLGGLSSCFILFGSSLLYVNSGITNLDGLYLVNNITEYSLNLDNIYKTFIIKYNPYYIHYALIILIVGFLFKVSAAPFHFWSPDVYDSIPTVVTTFVAIIAKISIFVFFLDLVFYLGKTVNFYSWSNSFLVSSLFSLIIGGVLGLTQSRIKRLYAYSTISHVGFILLALTVNNTESIQGYIFYILSYTITNLNAFIILVAMGYTLYLKVKKDEIKVSNKESKNSNQDMIDQENSPVQLISQLKGYFYNNAYLALSLAITLFSFVGVPPLIGFFAKQMVLSAALNNGYVFMSIIAVLTSVIASVYYLNLIKNMFFYKSDYMTKKNYDINAEIDIKKNQLNKTYVTYSSHSELSKENGNNDEKYFWIEDITIPSVITISISILTLIILLFILSPNEWLNIANILSYSIFHHD